MNKECKSPDLFTVMIALWGLCVLYFSPRLFALLAGPEPNHVKALLLIFILIQILFWFYIFFHLVIISFSYISPFRKTSIPSNSFSQSLVALLYTTCNDFQEDAARSHLEQDYKKYRLFILDDSNDIEYRLKVDSFANSYPGKVTVIRREGRVGFKAGNVNHALLQIPKEYEYFSISDADTTLPVSYISTLIPYVESPNIAFVQANLSSHQCQKTVFADHFAINTDIHFKRYTSTKNKYGFVMWYGHGALMRRDVYDHLGGFPEIATEDLAYSIKVREYGYEGIYCDQISCFEDFPLTYLQYRKRNEKWIRGTTECLIKYYLTFLKSTNVLWFEKLDVLVSAGTLFFAFPYVLFLIIGGILLPLFYHHFQFAGPMFKMPIAYDHLSMGMVQHIQSNLFWSWDLFILFLATIISPLLPVFIDYRREPKKVFNYLNIYIFCFFSVQVISVVHFIVGLITRTAVFPVTGEKEQSSDTHRSMSKPWYQRAHSNLNIMLWAEFIIGIIFMTISYQSQNIWFMPIALALIFSPVLFHSNLENRLIRQIVSFPLIMIVCILYFIVQGLVKI